MKFIRFFVFTLLIGALAGAATGSLAADKQAKANKKAIEQKEPASLWKVRCSNKIKNEGPKRGRCETFQRMVVKDTGQRFVEAAIGFPKDKKTARGIFIAPLGILIQPGMQIKFDQGQPYKFQVRYCKEDGCYGYVDLNDKLLEEMRKASRIVFTFIAPNQKTMDTEIRLKGFAETLDQID